MNAAGPRLLVLVGGRVVVDGGAQAVLSETALFRVEISGVNVTDALAMLWRHEGGAPGSTVLYFLRDGAAQDFADGLLRREYGPAVTVALRPGGVTDLLRR